jgi:hypothetical protein
MKFVALQLPNELPSWCSCQKGLGEEYICKIDWNDELLEVLGEDFDPVPDIQEELNCLGFGYVGWISTNFKIKDDCYLSDLNLTFPEGIPFKSVLPSLVVNGEYCFVINLSILNKRQISWVRYAYEADKIPVVLNALLQVKNLALVPVDLVEEIITA